MLAHTIKSVAKIDSLKYLLNKATLTGRLAKWAMILSGLDIHYIDRRAIKGQAIADQLIEAPLQDNHPIHTEFLDTYILTISTKPWVLYFDVSYKQHGSGASVLFVTLEGHTIPKSFRLMFPCTNNIVEYEDLVTRIKMDVEWKITELKVFGDS